MTYLKIQIQIVNCNTKKWLIKCLESLEKELLSNFLFTYSLKILDNNSSDDLNDIKELLPNIGGLEIYKNKINGDFGAGQNTLAQYGDSEYLLFLNPDIEFISYNTLNKIIKSAEKNNADVLGPKLIADNGSVQEWNHGNLRNRKLAIPSEESYWSNLDKLSEVAWVSGAFFLIKRNKFKALGGFDENLFLYKEEEDLCLRLRETGGKVVYDPTIKVFHIGGVSAKKKDHLERSVNIYLNKHSKNHEK